MADAKAFLRGDALLLLTATIWGFAFVAQRVGMESLGPFAFNGIRYLIGALSLLPLAVFNRGSGRVTSTRRVGGTRLMDRPWSPPVIAGLVMFAGSNLQQVGLVTTTAGNAAFITSLYVVIVPFLGALFGKRVGGLDWAASLVAVAGLYLITMGGGGFSVSGGDVAVIACAFFWALHILVIARFAPDYDPVILGMGQFTIAGVLSLVLSFATETISLEGIRAAAIPLLYGGIASCGVAFTLQIVGQRTARATHASIILALEGFFGALGGILLIGEPATARIIGGGALMLLAAVLPQVWKGLRGVLPGSRGAAGG